VDLLLNVHMALTTIFADCPDPIYHRSPLRLLLVTRHTASAGTSPASQLHLRFRYVSPPLFVVVVARTHGYLQHYVLMGLYAGLKVYHAARVVGMAVSPLSRFGCSVVACDVSTSAVSRKSSWDLWVSSSGLP
jgi:hypothetical protein